MFLILGLQENDRGIEALKIFEQMPIPPNEYTYSILLKVCAELADHQSFEFGQSSKESGYFDFILTNASET